MARSVFAARCGAGRVALVGLAAAMCAAAGCSSPGGAGRDGERPGEYVFWPPFPNEPRIQFLVSYSRSSDVQPRREPGMLESLVFGKERRDDLPIAKPYGVGMWEGKIYVCDPPSAAVVVLDLIKQQTRLMGVTGFNALKDPKDIAVADDGTKYVCDMTRGVIAVYDRSERFGAVFGHPGFEPVSAAVHGDELYVCDAGSKQVIVMDRYTGEERRRIGVPSSDEDGGLMWPLGIDVDDGGNVYVSDVIASTVQRFRPDGSFELVYGKLGDQTGMFRRPKHVGVGEDGVVYIVDAAFMNVQVFDSTGQLLTFFGGSGGLPGSMNLPAGVCVEELDEATAEVLDVYIHPAFKAERLIVVTNQFGAQKVSIYAYGSLREGKTVADIASTRLETPAGVGPLMEGRSPIVPVEPEEIPPSGEPDGGGGDERP